MNNTTNFISTYYPLLIPINYNHTSTSSTLLETIFIIYYTISLLIIIGIIFDNASLDTSCTTFTMFILIAVFFGWLIFPFLLMYWLISYVIRRIKK